MTEPRYHYDDTPLWFKLCRWIGTILFFTGAALFYFIGYCLIVKILVIVGVLSFSAPVIIGVLDCVIDLLDKGSR